MAFGLVEQGVPAIDVAGLVELVQRFVAAAEIIQRLAVLGRPADHLPEDARRRVVALHMPEHHADPGHGLVLICDHPFAVLHPGVEGFEVDLQRLPIFFLRDISLGLPVRGNRASQKQGRDDHSHHSPAFHRAS